MLRRRPDDRSYAHRWCLPGGRIDRGELPVDAAVRETAEETGLAVAIVRTLGPRSFELRQRKIVFSIHRFVARASTDVVTLSDEHVDARWLTRDDAARAGELLPGGLAGEVTRELLDRFAEGSELL